MTTLMALRFAAAKMGHGSSGFWDGKNLFNKANVYGMTQNILIAKDTLALLSHLKWYYLL